MYSQALEESDYAYGILKNTVSVLVKPGLKFSKLHRRTQRRKILKLNCQCNIEGNAASSSKPFITLTINVKCKNLIIYKTI